MINQSKFNIFSTNIFDIGFCQLFLSIFPLVSAQEDPIEDEVVDDSKIETDEEPAAEEDTATTGKVRSFPD